MSMITRLNNYDMLWDIFDFEWEQEVKKRVYLKNVLSVFWSKRTKYFVRFLM